MDMIIHYNNIPLHIDAMRVIIFLSAINAANPCMPGRSSAITDMTNLTKSGNFGSFTNCSKFFSLYIIK